MFIPFISESELKQKTTISSNVSIELLRPFFEQAQLMYIRPILGIALYSELETALSNNTLTAHQTTLLNYIKNALPHYIYYVSLPFIHTTTANKGVLVKSTENGQSVDLSALNFLRQNIMNQAEFFAKELKCFLEDNKSLFPNYRSCNTTKIKFSGIQFD